VNAAPATAIVAALRDELAYVYPPVNAATCVTGIGRDRIRAALEKLLDTHQLTRVMLIGFGGGLDPALNVADIVRVRHVLHEGSPPIELDTGSATLLTVDELAGSVKIKRELRDRSGADVVDMETYHVAAMLGERGVGLSVIRAITDPADAALPSQSTAWVKSDGRGDIAAVMRYLATHPWQLPTLLRLQRVSKQSAQALAEALTH